MTLTPFGDYGLDPYQPTKKKNCTSCSSLLPGKIKNKKSETNECGSPIIKNTIAMSTSCFTIKSPKFLKEKPGLSQWKVGNYPNKFGKQLQQRHKNKSVP